MKVLQCKGNLRFLKKYITKNLLTKHTENLSPYSYYIYTHFWFLKTAVKMYTLLFSGSSTDKVAGAPCTECGVGVARRGGPGMERCPPRPVCSGPNACHSSLWYGVYTSP